MAGLSDETFLKDEVNIVTKTPGQSTCKVYHGISRKASIISLTKKRNGKKYKRTTGLQKNDEELYFSDHEHLDYIINNEISQSEEVFFDFPTLSQYRKSDEEGNGSVKHSIHSIQDKLFPAQASNLQRAYFSYVRGVRPRMALILPRPRQEHGVYLDIDDYVFPSLQDLAQLGQCSIGLSTDDTLCPEMVRHTKILLDDLFELRDLYERQRRHKDYSSVGSQRSGTKTYATDSFIVLAAVLLMILSFYAVLISLQSQKK